MNRDTYIDEIRKAIISELESDSYSSLLKIAINKDGSISIKAKNILIAKLRYPKRSLPLIEIRSGFSEYFPAGIAVPFNDDYSRIIIAEHNDIFKYSKQLSDIFTTIIETAGGEQIGCCSKYIQCSDEKKCINPDPVLAYSCMYRKNLESGRIFYGKNKNI